MAEEAIVQSVRAQSPTSASANADHDTVAQTLKDSLRRAKAHAARARRTDMGLFIIVIIAPAVATLIAALAAAAGGNDLFPFITGVDDGGWKFACALAAGFSFIATLGSALKERVDKHLTQSKACVGRLLALDMALLTGHLSREEIMKEYTAVLKDHAEFMG
jgi:hypothetical protein